MSDNTIQHELDTITRTTRVLMGAAPKVATRIALGTTLAVEDVVTDPNAAILAAKLGQGAKVVGNTSKKIGSTISAKAIELHAQANTDEAKQARTIKAEAAKAKLGQVGGKIMSIPGLSKVGGFVTTAASELKTTWDEAGTIEIVIEQDDEIVQITKGLDAEACHDCGRTAKELDELQTNLYVTSEGPLCEDCVEARAIDSDPDNHTNAS